MVNYWLFVLVPFNDFNLMGTERRLKEKKWPIGRTTHFRDSFEKGDRVVIYLAREGNMKFIGNFELQSSLISDPNQDYVQMGEVNTFKKPLPIKDMINKLSFIKNKKHWGLHVSSGVIRIPQTDYDLIIKRGRGSRLISIPMS